MSPVPPSAFTGRGATPGVFGAPFGAMNYPCDVLASSPMAHMHQIPALGASPGLPASPTGLPYYPPGNHGEGKWPPQRDGGRPRDSQRPPDPFVGERSPSGQINNRFHIGNTMPQQSMHPWPQAPPQQQHEVERRGVHGFQGLQHLQGSWQSMPPLPSPPPQGLPTMGPPGRLNLPGTQDSRQDMSWMQLAGPSPLAPQQAYSAQGPSPVSPPAQAYSGTGAQTVQSHGQALPFMPSSRSSPCGSYMPPSSPSSPYVDAQRQYMPPSSPSSPYVDAQRQTPPYMDSYMPPSSPPASPSGMDMDAQLQMLGSPTNHWLGSDPVTPPPEQPPSPHTTPEPKKTHAYKIKDPRTGEEVDLASRRLRIFNPKTGEEVRPEAADYSSLCAFLDTPQTPTPPTPRLLGAEAWLPPVGLSPKAAKDAIQAHSPAGWAGSPCRLEAR